MRYVINIGCSVVKDRKEVLKVENQHFKLHFDNMSIACQWTLEKAKELYPELKYGAWNGIDNFSDVHYCHAILEQDNSIFQSEIIIDFCY